MQVRLFHRAQEALAWARVQSSLLSFYPSGVPGRCPLCQCGSQTAFGSRVHSTCLARLKVVCIACPWGPGNSLVKACVEQTKLAVRDLCQELDTGDSAWGQVFGTSSGGPLPQVESCSPSCGKDPWGWMLILLATALEATSQMFAHGLLSSVAAGLVVSLSFGPGAVLKSLAARRFRCPPMLQGGRH